MTLYDVDDRLVNLIENQFDTETGEIFEDISEEQKALYRMKGQDPISPDVEKIEQMGISVIPAKLVSKSDMVRHDPQKLAQAIMSLAYRLRLFGKGFVFFDYFFMRHNMRKISKRLGKES